MIALECMLFVANGVCAAIPDRYNFNLWVNLPVTVLLGVDLLLHI